MPADDAPDVLDGDEDDIVAANWHVQDQQGASVATVDATPSPDAIASAAADPRLLQAAREAIANGRTDVSRREFFDAIEAIAAKVRQPGENAEQAQRRARSTDEGQLLFKAMNLAEDPRRQQ